MSTLDDYKGQTPAWCPGCGNFGILRAFREAAVDLGLEPSQFMIVSGIGQAGKFPHYTRCNTFNGLHGRTLPPATGIRLVNNRMLTIAVAGDGDCYGEGGNHFIHAIRRNPNIKLFVHDNQIYGLTKGQPSPTSLEGIQTKSQSHEVLAEPLNPVALAISLDCSFVARSFAGDKEHLKEMMKQAINHKGFALVDIFQPCVTFNKVNTYEWYKKRVTPVGKDYNPENKGEAFKKALEFGETIPIGVLYKNQRPVMEERIAVIAKTPLVQQPFDPSKLEETLKKFY